MRTYIAIFALFAASAGFLLDRAEARESHGRVPLSPASDERALACVHDSCTVDATCARLNAEYACLCCKSTPHKRQVEMLVCIDPAKPVPACR